MGDDPIEHFNNVLPAHAGMIPDICALAVLVTRAPRACGDDPRIAFTIVTSKECSPRMRG